MSKVCSSHAPDRIHPDVLVIRVFCASRGARSRYGKLEVTCEVAGAEVFIDGRRYGRLPLKKAIRKREGTYTLRVSKPGYGDYLESVKIRRGKLARVTAYLTELTGMLEVDSTPSNAEVIINGRMYGHTPPRP